MQETGDNIYQIVGKWSKILNAINSFKKCQVKKVLTLLMQVTIHNDHHSKLESFLKEKPRLGL